jgi:hypothetical protein
MTPDGEGKKEGKDTAKEQVIYRAKSTWRACACTIALRELAS